MRITFVFAHAGYSGGVRVVASLAQRLQRRGHQVAAVSTAPEPPRLAQRARTLLSGNWPRAPKAGPSHLDDLGVEHRTIDRFRAVTDADLPNADVIVATWWQTAEWVTRVAPSKGVKVYFIQQYEANFGMPENRVAETWRLPLGKIVCSKWLADLARQRFGQSVLAVVNNGVDTELFNAPRRGKQLQPTVGLMYATNPAKGCDLSLAAIDKAARRVAGLKLSAFGNQPMNTSLPLPPQVKYSYLPAQREIRDIYRQCDVWLCGSRSEGFHLPPHEAMACRCPVVSTKVGGPMDMIRHGVDGYLVETEDVDALADRLVSVLSLSDPAWRKMSQSAYETARRYNWDAAADKFEQALYQAIDRAGGAKIARQVPQMSVSA